MMPRNSNRSGFTLIELMITIAVIAVLAAIAAPSFADLIERNRIKGAAEAIKSELQFARSEAIKQSCDVSIAFVDGAAWQTILTRCDGTTNVLNATSTKVSISASTFTDDEVTFRFRRGEADQNNSAVTIVTDNYSLQIGIVESRTVEICYPAGSTPISGFGVCT